MSVDFPEKHSSGDTRTQNLHPGAFRKPPKLDTESSNVLVYALDLSRSGRVRS